MAAELVNEPEPSRQSASLLVGTCSSKRLHRTASNNLKSIEHRQPQFNDKRKSKNQHTPPIHSLLRSSRPQLPPLFSSLTRTPKDQRKRASFSHPYNPSFPPLFLLVHTTSLTKQSTNTAKWPLPQHQQLYLSSKQPPPPPPLLPVPPFSQSPPLASAQPASVVLVSLLQTHCLVLMWCPKSDLSSQMAEHQELWCLWQRRVWVT